MNLIRLLTAFAATPWAMLPERLEAISAILLQRHGELSSGISGLIGPVEPAAAAPAANKPGQQQGVVAVIPVWGVIANRAHMVEGVCGDTGTSTEKLDARIKSAIADPNVRAIVLDVSSPGGSVFGVQEVARTVFEGRSVKPILANANSLAASAAYWIASAATELHVTPSGEVGSIGVYGAHVDISKAEEMQGLKTTLISAGKFKTEGHPYGPLESDAAKAMQARVDEYYGEFVRGVAKHRGVGVDDVRNGFGEGRTVGSKQAKAENMVDEIATLEETIARAQKLARQAERQSQSTTGAAPARELAAARLAIASAS